MNLLETFKIKKLLKKLKKTASQTYRSGSTFDMSNLVVESGSARLDKEMDERLEFKPVEVFKEILSEIKPVIRLAGLEEQIRMVKYRKDFMEKHLKAIASDEDEALKFLNSRKKYLKNMDEFPWAVSTYDSIEKLCKKYKLREVNASSWYKTLPMEALEEMERFLLAWEKVREANDQPNFRLIVDDFSAGKETKKDPILLVHSPFGKWFYFLGAWDKEVQYVDDIIYKGK